VPHCNPEWRQPLEVACFHVATTFADEPQSKTKELAGIFLPRITSALSQQMEQ
jgi:hypothetical protein